MLTSCCQGQPGILGKFQPPKQGSLWIEYYSVHYNIMEGCEHACSCVWHSVLTTPSFVLEVRLSNVHWSLVSDKMMMAGLDWGATAKMQRSEDSFMELSLSFHLSGVPEPEFQWPSLYNKHLYPPSRSYVPRSPFLTVRFSLCLTFP